MSSDQECNYDVKVISSEQNAFVCELTRSSRTNNPTESSSVRVRFFDLAGLIERDKQRAEKARNGVH
jgi:hypothetical protein